MAVIVYEYRPLGGGMAGWDSTTKAIRIYSSIDRAEKEIKKKGCTVFRDRRWTRELVKGEYFSNVSSYIIGEELPYNEKL